MATMSTTGRALCPTVAAIAADSAGKRGVSECSIGKRYHFIACVGEANVDRPGVHVRAGVCTWYMSGRR